MNIRDSTSDFAYIVMHSYIILFRHSLKNTHTPQSETCYRRMQKSIGQWLTQLQAWWQIEKSDPCWEMNPCNSLYWVRQVRWNCVTLHKLVLILCINKQNLFMVLVNKPQPVIQKKESWYQQFQDNILIPSSRAKQSWTIGCPKTSLNNYQSISTFWMENC